MKLKHDCPAPSKYGTDELLWKTATISFLRAVRDCVVMMEKFSDRSSSVLSSWNTCTDYVTGAEISTINFEGIWRQIIEGFRGALLADVYVRLRVAR